MEKNEVIQIKVYEDTITFYQKILERGVEFPQGFDSNGNPETNLSVAKRIVKTMQQTLQEYKIAMGVL